MLLTIFLIIWVVSIFVSLYLYIELEGLNIASGVVFPLVFLLSVIFGPFMVIYLGIALLRSRLK